jgi:hypothetical protein
VYSVCWTIICLTQPSGAVAARLLCPDHHIETNNYKIRVMATSNARLEKGLNAEDAWSRRALYWLLVMMEEPLRRTRQGTCASSLLPAFTPAHQSHTSCPTIIPSITPLSTTTESHCHRILRLKTSFTLQKLLSLSEHNVSIKPSALAPSAAGEGYPSECPDNRLKEYL